MIFIYRWEDLPVLKAILLRKRCSRGQLLRPEGAAVSCALAEVCAWAWELSGQLLVQQLRAEDLVKVRSQHWSSPSQSNLSAQRLIRKAKITQVNETFPPQHIFEPVHLSARMPDGGSLLWATVYVRFYFSNPQFGTLGSYLIFLLLCSNE